MDIFGSRGVCEGRPRRGGTPGVEPVGTGEGIHAGVGARESMSMYMGYINYATALFPTYHNLQPALVYKHTITHISMSKWNMVHEKTRHLFTQSSHGFNPAVHYVGAFLLNYLTYEKH